MTATTVFTTYRTWETQKSNAKFSANNDFSATSQNCCFEADTTKAGDVSQLLSQATMQMQKFANSKYKTNVMIEPTEIDQIKNSLNNYVSDDTKVAEFKKEILNDLTDFQEQIKTNYIGRIEDFYKQKQLCERQIKVLDVEKHKLIMDRLSKIEWPYDKKTQEYDNKIAALKTQSKQLEQKMEEAQQMRPAANEKDLLIYQLKLKEKYSKKD